MALPSYTQLKMLTASPEANAPEVVVPPAGLEPSDNFEDSDKQAQAENSYQAYEHNFQPHNRSRNPFGLGPLAFGGLVALLTAILIGTAVGGGLASSLASCNKQKSNNSPNANTFPTGTSTGSSSAPSSDSSNGFHQLLSNYSVAEASTVDSLYYDCPTLNSQTYETHFHQTFSLTCGIDYTEGLAAADGGVISNIAAIIAYSPEDCFEACSNVNHLASVWNTGVSCESVTWTYDMKNATNKLGGNCWLKNSTLASGASASADKFAVTGVLD